MRLRRSRETLSVFLIEIKEFKQFEERSQNPGARRSMGRFTSGGEPL
jgi:hypothetical protein